MAKKSVKKMAKKGSRVGSGYFIGVASCDITPPIGVKLSGYGSRTEPSTGIGHRLRAEALVCEGEEGAWALLTSDVIGYPRQFVLSVREKAAKKTGIPASAMLISGTHTHSGPAVRQIYREHEEPPPLDREYTEELEEKLARLIEDAWKARKPGIFEAAWSEAPDLASNRRVQLPDGTWVNEWQDFEGKHQGYFDPSVLLVAVRRPDGKRDVLFVNYGCHPVTLGPRNLRISADYPGYLKDLLEARGVCTTAMFGLAGGGNINPRVCIMVGAEYPRRMGEALAEKVLAAVPNLSPVFPGKVSAASSEWRFLRRPRQMPGQATATRSEEAVTEVQALRAGDLIFLAVPGELFSEYVAIFRDASPVPVTAVVSLANDSVGYLPVDGAVPQGGHEVTHAAAHYIQEALVSRAKDAMARTG